MVLECELWKDTSQYVWEYLKEFTQQLDRLYVCDMSFTVGVWGGEILLKHDTCWHLISNILRAECKHWAKYAWGIYLDWYIWGKKQENN